MTVPKSAHLLFERRLEHARLRSLLAHAVRGVSFVEGDRLGIELHDDRIREHEDLAAAASCASPSIKPDLAPVPPLSIAVLVVGSRGDVQPFLPIARRLRDDGHRVRIATHAVFREFVEGHGVEFFPLAGDPRELMEYMVMTGGRLVPLKPSQILEQVPRKREIMREIIASTWAACTEPDPGDPAARPFVADAVIANPPSQGHIHVAEALHAPLHIMFTMPWSPTRSFPHPFTRVISDARSGLRNRLSYETFDLLTWLGTADLVNDFREHKLSLERMPLGPHGASLVHELEVPHAYLWSRCLLEKPQDWGPRIDVTGFVFLDEASHFEPPPALEKFLGSGDPPVYVGFGSCPAPDPKTLTATLFEGLARAGVRGLVARGWAHLESTAPPAHVHLVDELPHDWLFPRCAAACHHGGAGTTAASLRNGLPTVIVPFFGDQYFWGRIVSEAGAGPTPVPIGSLTAETLAEAIRLALSPKVRERARELARKVAAEMGPEESVACFYRQLPLDVMHCRLDTTHLARRWCETCRLALCVVCDAVVHDDPSRREHRRYPFGHLTWEVSPPKSVLERLERTLANPLAAPKEAGEGREPEEKKHLGVVLRDEGSVAAKLHGRLAPVAVDAATRESILKRFEAATRS